MFAQSAIVLRRDARRCRPLAKSAHAPSRDLLLRLYDLLTDHGLGQTVLLCLIIARVCALRPSVAEGAGGTARHLKAQLASTPGKVPFFRCVSQCPSS